MADFEIVASSEAEMNAHRLENIDRNMRRGIRQGFFAVGSQLRKTARAQMLEKPKSGRLYRIKRGSVRRLHRASAPGESPANRSGQSRKSIGYQISGVDSMQFGWGGRASGLDYPIFLDKGTSKMEPRPLLENTVNADEGTIERLFLTNVSKAIT